MDDLLSNARRLLETAQAGPGAEDWTVCVRADHGLHLVAGHEGSLESALWSLGARAVWRVTHRGQQVRVEGFDGRSRVALEGKKRSPAAQALLGGGALYSS